MILDVLESNDPDPDPCEWPSYDTPGRILVRVRPPDAGPYNHEYEVLGYDADSSVHMIIEGTGFDYWLDAYCEFPCPGLYVVEGITGQYYRGDWSWGEDDDEDWEYVNIRRASWREAATARWPWLSRVVGVCDNP